MKIQDKLKVGGKYPFVQSTGKWKNMSHRGNPIAITAIKGTVVCGVDCYGHEVNLHLCQWGPDLGAKLCKST